MILSRHDVRLKILLQMLHSTNEMEFELTVNGIIVKTLSNFNKRFVFTAVELGLIFGMTHLIGIHLAPDSHERVATFNMLPSRSRIALILAASRFPRDLFSLLRKKSFGTSCSI